MKVNDRNQDMENRYKRNFYSFIDITPSYNLRVKEDIVHDFLGRHYVFHGGAGPLEVIHQVLVVIGVPLLWEARFHQAKVVPPKAPRLLPGQQQHHSGRHEGPPPWRE